MNEDNGKTTEFQNFYMFLTGFSSDLEGKFIPFLLKEGYTIKKMSALTQTSWSNSFATLVALELNRLVITGGNTSSAIEAEIVKILKNNKLGWMSLVITRPTQTCFEIGPEPFKNKSVQVPYTIVLEDPDKDPKKEEEPPQQKEISEDPPGNSLR